MAFAERLYFPRFLRIARCVLIGVGSCRGEKFFAPTLIVEKMTQIIIDLPDDLVASAQHLGEATERDVSEVLVDALAIILPTFKELGAIAKSADLSHLLG